MTNLAPNKDDSQLEAEKLSSQFATANGVRLHYVTSGSGEPVVLIHGYPETWYAWHKIIPTLAEEYTVIAPDLRGLGESDIAATGYEKRTVAEDVHQLLLGLGIERFMLVAHDMGVPVAYALANAYPETVASFVAIESGIPGFGLEQAMDVGKRGSWHFGFFMSEFAEMLTQGREKEFLTKFAFTGEFVHRKEAISQDDIDTYVSDYSKPGRMSAGFAYYRAFESDAKYNGEMELPLVNKGEVRVKVHISGVNPSDTKGRSGWGGNSEMQFPRVIPHQDGAGVIESVGEGVPTSRIGERVWIYEAQQHRPFGTAAEYIVVPAKNAVRLPDNTDFEIGACLGVPAMTAHRCLFADASIAGQTVLVSGGAGAVGLCAVQLAKWGGAKVITTVSKPEQAEVVSAAGADDVINYKTEDVGARVKEITQGSGVDRIVEVAFGNNINLDQTILKPSGVISTYEAGAEPEPKLPFYPLMLNGITV